MQPTEHNLQLPGNGANRPLPRHLARSLGPDAKRALTHWMRRHILRMLSKAPTPRTTKDLQTTLPGVSLSTVSYHVLVLEDCKSVLVSGVEQGRGTIARSIVSNVIDNAQYVAVLQATELSDDAR